MGNDVFEFFFVASSGISLGVLLLGIVPYKLCKYMINIFRRNKHVG